MNDLAIFDTVDPRTLALLNSDSSGIGAALGGGLSGGINRLSIRSSRFRFYRGGTEVYVHPERTLKVVIIAASPSVSRIWFKTPYGQVEGARPTCWSRDGVAPEAPLEQIPQIETNRGWRPVHSCAECPNNIKGSGQNGGRACQFKKRIVIVSPDDIEGEAWAFDINAMSLFGESDPASNLRSLKDYVQYLASPRGGFPHGIPPHAIVTQLTFDEKPAVPVVRFGVALNSERSAAFLGPDQISAAALRGREPDVLHLLNVDAEEYAASAPVDSMDGVAEAPEPDTQRQQVVREQEPQHGQQHEERPLVEPPGLMHPDVPETVREWAQHPLVTEDMVTDYLLENYPHALEVPQMQEEVPPPPPPPASKAPPSPPKADAQGTARRTRRRTAANDPSVGQAQQSTQAPPRQQAGFVPPKQAEDGTSGGTEGRPSRGFVNPRGTRAAVQAGDGEESESGIGTGSEAGFETGIGGTLEAKVAALLNGTTDD
ncbi:hypothetical protein P3T23_004509 [Paraburkholderia sp. GAS448]|uniref:hypothetical protein n=1 Tax=Paraburkholderia sp. GAS448 TaxID=3035136 RepID=UPI003D235802